VKLVRRKRGRSRQGDAEQDVEAKLAAELESARAALADERRAAAEARSALEAERERCAELERTLDGERRGGAAPPGRLEPRGRAPSEGRNAKAKAAGKKRRWAAAKELAAEGVSQREIARRLRLNRRTVARLVAADEPPRYQRKPQGSMLDPLEPVMRSVLQDTPRIDAPAMTQLLREHGYRGSVDLVRRRLRRIRSPD
jgi:Homeodomain-like domain-containing protein